MASLFVVFLLSSVTTFRSAHPADGPDVDFRITVGEESVRLAVTMNLAFVDEIVPMLRESRDAVHPAEHKALAADLLTVLRKGLTVTIDGVKVPAALVDFAVDIGDPDLLPLMPNMGMRALTRCRLLLDHPLTGAPKTVGITWGLYPPNWAETGFGAPDAPPIAVKAQVFAEGVTEEITFLKEEPEYVWHATGKTWRDHLLPVPRPAPPVRRRVPWLSLLVGFAGISLALLTRRSPRRQRYAWLVAAALAAFALRAVVTVEIDDPFSSPNSGLTPGEARSIFLPLHANIYRAFAFSEDTAIYDVLAESVAGDLLERTYGSIHESLILREHGGAICRVTEVRPLRVDVESIGNLEPDDSLSFRVLAQWQVDGRVTHWGHSHDRTLEYEARYTVSERPEGWRIVGTETLAQRRFDPTGRDATDR